ncbi:hypothetical protein GCK32_019946, partial [Trichostrongylus colubriformis]
LRISKCGGEKGRPPYFANIYATNSIFTINNMDWLLIAICAWVMVTAKMIATCYYVRKWSRYRAQEYPFLKSD